MENPSKRFELVFRQMYESEKINVKSNISYNDIIKNNKSRLAFLNFLLDMAEKENLSFECKELLENNIDFIHSFLNGDYFVEIPVPKKYFDDMWDCLIVPSQEELNYMFSLIEQNVAIYDSTYKNCDFLLKLPDNSLNMNMYRVLEVKKKNLAHLIGLTDSEKQPNPNKNLLKKYFIKNISNPERYGKTVSEQLLNWILSEEGKKEIKKINQITIDFIEKDEIKNPTAYDEKGKIKDLKKFKERFKESTDYDFPIIKFSRYISKCINNINYLNLTNITQMILDYNAPINPETNEKTEKDEKDIFIVNVSQDKLIEITKKYIQIYNAINKLIRCYANNDKNNLEIEYFLKKQGINVRDKDIEKYINLIKSYDFVGKHGIKPDCSKAIDMINREISKYFLSDIHLIGFGTDFKLDEQKNIIPIDLNTRTINYAHCDTSISINITDLINKYYKRGRAFFIDRIYDTKGNVLRISIPKEELNHMELLSLLNMQEKSDFNELKEELELFEEKYESYKNTFRKGKK